ncbi:hypothetical protein JHD47_02880 [Sulfurimonas sp. SAG-AH-194-L11]|nr:hypothetical protein [Sulfurimonas sp. SAG-AH-194-L11]MDF1876756.1 hypothetical protein [Sulfurimonas sp. SAG-AH-194-L11]
MNFKKIFFSILLIITTLTLSNCQGGNGDSTSSTTTTTSGNTTIPPVTADTSVTIVLPMTSTTLTTNNQVVNIEVNIFDSANNPYSEGTINKINPDDVISGRDVGTFDTISSSIVNGVATFVYTAPASLDINTSDIVFRFYHSSDSSTVVTYTMVLSPELNQTVLTNYTLKTSSQDGVSMALESSETVSYTLYDASGSEIPDSSINSMVATSLNPSIATLSDSFGNIDQTTLSLLNSNNMTININSNTVSGIVPIRVETNFTDANGDDQNITEVFSVLVLSGPPSAISLSYASTEQVASRAKFLEKWVVTVTDKYNNLVNSNPSVSVGMLAGFTQSSSATTNPGNYLHFVPDAAGSGGISATNDTFTAPAGVFSNVDIQNDVLAVYGTGYKYDASGKWDINTINSASVLNLKDDYNSTDRTGLGFAVGNNQREDTCQIGTKWVANVYADGNIPIIDSTGTMVINVEYDYYLVGKSTILWVNLVGIQNSTGEQLRIGEARKINLRGQGLTGERYSYAKGFTGVVRLDVTVTNTTEYYYNANFDYQVVVTGDDTNWTEINNSMISGITSCDNSGIAYVEVNVTSSLKAGEIQLNNVLPSAEF